LKISIPTEGIEVSPHFGRCPEFTIAEIVEGKVVDSERLANPGHSPGAIPQFLREKGVDCIICSGIGRRAIDLFAECDIQVLQGVEGRINDVIEAYRRGELSEGESTCEPGDGKGYGLDKSVCDHQ
jgi:predicted Fe-Mo cluster-binding NifX family protein